MPIKLMYITNNPQVASIVENSGVDRIFIDMEYIGKDLRQGGMDTVQNCHKVKDIVAIRKVIKKADLLVRCNPIHDAGDGIYSTEEEIEEIIASGADIIMLPYFRTVSEVERFIKAINKRTKSMLLFETPESVEIASDILELEGIDEVFIGLNDLSLGYGYKFMFQPLANGIVENLCSLFRKKGLPYGFGGLASLDGGLLPGRYIVAEHCRLGSASVILSRSFCNTSKIKDPVEIDSIFKNGIKQIREFEDDCRAGKIDIDSNHNLLKQIVCDIVKEIR